MRSNRLKILIILSLFMILLLMSYVFMLAYSNRNENQILTRYSEKLDNEYDILVGIYNDLAGLVFQNEINTEPVLTLLSLAYSSDNKTDKNRYRSELYDYLLPLYRNIKIEGFPLIHFHEPEDISFLRMSAPELYGDDLKGIRDTVEAVGGGAREIRGFEVGKSFSGYRNVFSLEKEGLDLGSVEIGFTMNILIEYLKKLFEGEAWFILYRPDDDPLTSDNEIWNIDNMSVRERRGLIQSVLKKLNTGKDSFSIHIHKGLGTVLTFKAIRDYRGRSAGFFLLRMGSSDIVENQRAFIFITLTFILLILVLLIFMFYFNRSEKKIEEMVTNDLLTGAYSRRIILEKLDFELSRFRRYGNPVCICMIDIDHFKEVNDNYGHLVGDSVLAEIAGIFLDKIRNTDIFGRYGGEEFLLILPGTNRETAFLVMENLRKEVELYSYSFGGSLTVSSGIARINHEDDIHSLIGRADEKLYRAKESGRNLTVCED